MGVFLWVKEKIVKIPLKKEENFVLIDTHGLFPIGRTIALFVSLAPVNVCEPAVEV